MLITCSCSSHYLGLCRTIIFLEQQMPLAFVCSPCRNHCDIFELNFSCFNVLKTKLNQVEREVLSGDTYQYQGSHLPRINLSVPGLPFFLSDIENYEYIEINKCCPWVHNGQALVNSRDYCCFFFFFFVNLK